jgi:hypothetical protein
VFQTKNNQKRGTHLPFHGSEKQTANTNKNIKQLFMNEDEPIIWLFSD